MHGSKDKKEERKENSTCTQLRILRHPIQRPGSRMMPCLFEYPKAEVGPTENQLPPTIPSFVLLQSFQRSQLWRDRISYRYSFGLFLTYLLLFIILIIITCAIIINQSTVVRRPLLPDRWSGPHHGGPNISQGCSWVGHPDQILLCPFWFGPGLDIYI